MNAYNAEKHVHEAIVSVIGQTYKKWELIFWDNCSNDKTSKIVKLFKDKRIKYFKSKIHTTLGPARLSALEKCNGQFVAFLDSDDIWIKNKLELQMPFFNDNDVGIVSSNSEFFNKNGFVRNLYTNSFPQNGYVFEKLLENYNLAIETVVLRRSYIEKLDHSFDQNFHSILDFDLFIRIAEISKLYNLKEVTAKWRMHEKNETFLFPEKFINEFILWQKKIINRYPNIINKYKKSWKKFENKTKIEHSEYLLFNNNCKKSNKLIKSIKFYNFKSFLIFLCSLAPFGKYLYKLILTLKRKI
jgi:glycosyltransferase involved in cell wall biosynthesis